MNDKELIESIYIHKPLKDNLNEGADIRWNNKKVLDSKILFDGTDLSNFMISDEFESSLVKFDNHNCLRLKTTTDIEGTSRKRILSTHFNLKEHDLSKYNRVVIEVYLAAKGYHSFFFICGFGDLLDSPSHCPAVEPNKWNQIMWEVEDIKRDDIKTIHISPWIMGLPPEALPDYEIYISNIRLEKVEADYVLGWDLEDRIAYSHVGYLTGYKKEAIIKYNNLDSFSLCDELGNEIYHNKIKKIDNFDLEYGLLDFSDFNKEGKYYLKVGNKKTHLFEISAKAYDETIWKSINFLYLLRCGEDIPGIHSACHLNCRSINDEGVSVPNFGGWHDAGDVSQFEIPTAEMSDALISLALKVKDKDLMMYERLREEARIGLNWLLRTRFSNGERALTVTYSIWRKNILDPNNKTIYTNKAENGPFENFLSAAALAKAYVLYKEEDEIFADWCKRSAIEDFDFACYGYDKGIYTKRWGPSIPSQCLGEGIYAACELYKITADMKYLDISVKYADVVMACQETGKLKLDLPLHGFFYEDTDHKYLLTYEHRGHEESAVKGIVSLCKIYKEHENYDKWVKCLKLYASYVKNSMFVTLPYGLIPGHIYIEGKINYDRYTVPKNYAETDEIGMAILEHQKLSGKRVGDGVYLRIFPISIQRRGFHATLLSKTKAISSIGELFNDDVLLSIAKDQLEWILGKNPFATSTMYGVGHNYHPLYVAFTNQMVGALPVGIMTKKDEDKPFWPVRDEAVYKEVWGHTTGKYLSVLVDILK